MDKDAWIECSMSHGIALHCPARRLGLLCLSKSRTGFSKRRRFRGHRCRRQGRGTRTSSLRRSGQSSLAHTHRSRGMCGQEGQARHGRYCLIRGESRVVCGFGQRERRRNDGRLRRRRPLTPIRRKHEGEEASGLCRANVSPLRPRRRDHRSSDQSKQPYHPHPEKDKTLSDIAGPSADQATGQRHAERRRGFPPPAGRCSMSGTGEPLSNMAALGGRACGEVPFVEHATGTSRTDSTPMNDRDRHGCRDGPIFHVAAGTRSFWAADSAIIRKSGVTSEALSHGENQPLLPDVIQDVRVLQCSGSPAPAS